MTDVATSVDVDVPLHTADDQWTRVEGFPSSMEGIDDVRRLDGQAVRCRGDVGGQERESTARIIEQEPHGITAWRGEIEGGRGTK